MLSKNFHIASTALIEMASFLPATDEFDARCLARARLRVEAQAAQSLRDAQRAALAAAALGDEGGLSRIFSDWPLAPQTLTEDGSTLLIEAVCWGAPVGVLELIAKVANIDESDRKGQTALMKAAARFAKNIPWLAARANAALADESGRTALMWAAAVGNAEALSVLSPLSNPLAASDAGQTALMLAAAGDSCGHERCALLLAPISDLRAQNRQGKTAAQIACSRGGIELGALLRAAQAQNLSFVV